MTARDRAGDYKVNVNRGERIGRVSSEWFSRPADGRPLSLSELPEGNVDQTRQHDATNLVGLPGRNPNLADTFPAA
jgi:hypothetical protein